MTLAAIIVGVFAVVVILSAKAHSDRQRAARQAEALDAAIEAEKACPMSLAVDDPTPDEPMVPIVAGSTEPELVDELPPRARAIEVPREGEPQEGAVLQGRWRPCTPCFDAHADQRPDLMRHDACRRVFYGSEAVTR